MVQTEACEVIVVATAFHACGTQLLGIAFHLHHVARRCEDDLLAQVGVDDIEGGLTVQGH